MGTLGLIDDWMSALHADIETCAVTKHAAHAYELDLKLKGVNVFKY